MIKKMNVPQVSKVLQERGGKGDITSKIGTYSSDEDI
jgi:hypothetical protein